MKIFITGISTNVGKTIASAIITESLEADYWKPVQAGDLHFTDSNKVTSLISNSRTKIFAESFALKLAASPHEAAENESISIGINKIVEPLTDNHLVIEGAGGLFVPLNEEHSIIDLIKPDYKVIVVSQNYLGSINHTLLTLEALKTRNLTIAGIIFSGHPNAASEQIILKKSGADLIGIIDHEPYFDRNVVLEYADLFRQNLMKLTTSI